MLKKKPCEWDGCNNIGWSNVRINGKKTLLCAMHKDIVNKENKGNAFKQPSKPLKKTKVNNVSTKQKKSNREVNLAKLRVKQRHLDEHGYFFCTSCGTREGFIDTSHVIPISSDKSLEACEDIIFLQCRDRCHPITERGLAEMTEFNNYDEIMAAIKKHNPDFWRKLMVKHGLL